MVYSRHFGHEVDLKSQLLGLFIASSSVEVGSAYSSQRAGLEMEVPVSFILLFSSMPFTAARWRHIRVSFESLSLFRFVHLLCSDGKGLPHWSLSAAFALLPVGFSRLRTALGVAESDDLSVELVN